MAKTIEVDITYAEERHQYGKTTPGGPGLYCLEVAPLMAEVDVADGDIIQQNASADGSDRRPSEPSNSAAITAGPSSSAR